MKPFSQFVSCVILRVAGLCLGVWSAVAAVVLFSGCAAVSPRDVVLLDDRGAVPPPYVRPGTVAPERPPVREPSFPEHEPLEPIEPLIFDEETGYPVLEEPAEPPVEPVIPDHPEPEIEVLTYTVQSGDSLWSISRKYGVSHHELAAFNDMQLDDVLVVGRELEIPPGGTRRPPEQRQVERRPDPPRQPVPTPDRELVESEKYTVRGGDSLSVIARDFGVRVNEIKAINDLTSDLIYEGQTLIIPQPAEREPRPPVPTLPEPETEDLEPWEIEPDEPVETRRPEFDEATSTISHVVTDDGESLSDIADMYGIDVEVIRRHNPDISERTLRSDTVIKIPVL